MIWWIIALWFCTGSGFFMGASYESQIGFRDMPYFRAWSIVFGWPYYLWRLLK
jgi:hypothetical protein